MAADFEAGMSLRLPTNLEAHPRAIGTLLTRDMAKSCLAGNSNSAKCALDVEPNHLQAST